MYAALERNNLEEVRRQLDLGVDVTSVLNNREIPVDTLLCTLQPWQPAAAIAELLIERGAYLTSDESKEIFVRNVDFMVSYGTDHEGLPFETYLPILRVFAKNGLLSSEQMNKVSSYAREDSREQIEAELVFLSSLMERHSKAVLENNSYVLLQAERTGSVLGKLPKDLRRNINALTANPRVHTYEAACLLSTSFFAKEHKRVSMRPRQQVTRECDEQKNEGLVPAQSLPLMYFAIIRDDVEGVRRLLDLGADATTLLNPEGKPEDTLLCVVCRWKLNAAMAELLIERGAHLTSNESRRIFASNLKLVIGRGIENGYPFEAYLPILSVFSKHSLLSFELLHAVSSYAPPASQEQIEVDLMLLFPSSSSCGMQ